MKIKFQRKLCFQKEEFKYTVLVHTAADDIAEIKGLDLHRVLNTCIIDADGEKKIETFEEVKEACQEDMEGLAGGDFFKNKIKELSETKGESSGEDERKDGKKTEVSHHYYNHHHHHHHHYHYHYHHHHW